MPGSVSTIERGGSDVDSHVLASASMQYVLELGGVVEQTNASMGLPRLLTRQDTLMWRSRTVGSDEQMAGSHVTGGLGEIGRGQRQRVGRQSGG